MTHTNPLHISMFRLKKNLLALLAGSAILTGLAGNAFVHAEDKEPISLFDGKTLEGWSGMKGIWSVEDGAIVGVNPESAPVKHNTFLVSDKKVKDFELTLEFKLEGKGGNSGVQYRSKLADPEKFIVGGYQADIAGAQYMGINYEERGRGIIALRGEIIAIDDQGKKSKIGTSGDPDALISRVKLDDWNTYKIVAKGNTLQHFINGALMSEVQDGETAKRASEGVVAFQVHQGPPMKVRFRKIFLTEL